MTTAPIEPRESNWVGCAICLNLRGERVRAQVTVNGLSVCVDHAPLAARPGFDIGRIRGGTTRSEPL
jgi:hypothetical protein